MIHSTHVNWDELKSALEAQRSGLMRLLVLYFVPGQRDRHWEIDFEWVDQPAAEGAE